MFILRSNNLNTFFSKIFFVCQKNLPFIFLLFALPVVAQQNIPLSHSVFNSVEAEYTKPQIGVFTSFKPVDKSQLNKFRNIDSLLYISRADGGAGRSFLIRKLRYENLVVIDTGDFRLTIDPLFNLEFSKQSGYSRNLYNNTRGVIAQGNIGKKFNFETSFYENQTIFNEYLTAFVNKYKVVPGQGYAKPYKDIGKDYAIASGHISYSPNEYFNFQLGHGKHFVGEGYRSLLLSDNAFNYPYLRVTTNIWRISYTNLFTSFLDLNTRHTYEQGFYKKFGTFHFLNIDVCKHFQLGFFESIIWQNSTDSTGYKRGLDLNYLNPVIFYRPVEYSLGSPDNALIGVNAKLKITNKFYLFGQLVIDDFDVAGLKKGKGYILEKYGFQAGFRLFDILNVKNFNIHAEYNQVQPYVYAHKVPLQNYSHYNQALAHPLGANFKEIVGTLKYSFKDFFFEYKAVYALYGSDTTSSHWGKNIFKSDNLAQLGYPSWGNKILQGVKTTLMHHDFRVSYLLNPKTNMNLMLGVATRSEKTPTNNLSNYFIFVGFRTSLTNHYYDF